MAMPLATSEVHLRWGTASINMWAFSVVLSLLASWATTTRVDRLPCPRTNYYPLGLKVDRILGSSLVPFSPLKQILGLSLVQALWATRFIFCLCSVRSLPHS